MTKKGVMVFLFFFKKQTNKQKTAFFSFYQRSAAVPYCMIKENSSCNVTAYIQRLFVRDTGTLLIANKHLIALECFLTNAAKHGLTETQFTLICFLNEGRVFM